MLEKVINRKSKYPRPYWILIHTAWDNAVKAPMGLPVSMQKNFGKNIRQHDTGLVIDPRRVLRTNLVVMPTKPTHPVVGTACVEIDNKLGKATWLWCLPMDAPRPAIEQEKGSENESVFESARKIPGAILY